MAVNWLRRSVLTAACASVALLAACGSSTIESALESERVVAFDVGQLGGTSYTVNDGSVNDWTTQLAASDGVPLQPTPTGSSSYASGNARVSAKPDAAGNNSTLTVTEQIDAFLASGSIKENDLVVLGAGTADIIAEMAAVTAGTHTPDQMLSLVQDAGRALGAQIERLVQAGAQHVVVAGTYNLGRSPWAKSIGQTALLEQASSKFNEAFLVRIVNLGANVLYVDRAYYFNLVTASPSSYGFTDVSNPVCTSVDPRNGIGIGVGQVNSALCTPSTLLPGVTDYSKYLFADSVYFTPAAERLFGTYAYDRLRLRW